MSALKKRNFGRHAAVTLTGGALSNGQVSHRAFDRNNKLWRSQTVEHDKAPQIKIQICIIQIKKMLVSISVSMSMSDDLLRWEVRTARL